MSTYVALRRTLAGGAHGDMPTAMSLHVNATLPVPSLDDFLDLPPLQDPYPSSISALSSRPSPLEPRPDKPISRDAQSKGSALSSRQKALAQAQPLGSCELKDLEINVSGSNDTPDQIQRAAAPDPEQARKKAKLRHNEQIADFVHLPKLQATKPKEERRRPFRPIAVLNQLNEPPPSAGLFPPITPRASQGPETQEGQESAQHAARSNALEQPTQHLSKRTDGTTRIKEPKERKKKVFLRERIRWTEEEAEQLVKGVAIYGMGRWKNILDHPEFDFHPGRTHVDLKDKYTAIELYMICGRN